MRDTSMRGASMRGTSMRGTPMRGTPMRGTSMRGTPLRGIPMNLTGSEIRFVLFGPDGRVTRVEPCIFTVALVIMSAQLALKHLYLSVLADAGLSDVISVTESVLTGRNTVTTGELDREPKAITDTLARHEKLLARHGYVPHGRVPHGCVPHGAYTSWVCTSWRVYLMGMYLMGVVYVEAFRFFNLVFGEKS